MKFLKALQPKIIKEQMNQIYKDIIIDSELLSLEEALGRIISSDVYSSVNIPDFNKSTVDGYALKSKDTNGASDNMPAFIDNIGEVLMGKEAVEVIEENQCVYVPTGGMVPLGADAVVMIEYIDKLDEITIAVNSTLHSGENIIYIGEDIRINDLVVTKGKELTPYDIGALSAIGVSKVSVYKKPQVVIFSTGDEIRKPEDTINIGEVRDINSYVIEGLVKKYGGEVLHKSIFNDDIDKLKNGVEKWIEKCDLLVISGGSSAGIKDVTVEVLDNFGEPGVFVHGVAVKPGKPTILSYARKTAMFGLPGHPGSSSIIFNIFGKELFNIILHKSEKIESFIEAELMYSLVGSPGKETYVMGKLVSEGEKYRFYPLIKKSSAISQISQSNGYVKIDGNTEGIEKGRKVKVFID